MPSSLMARIDRLPSPGLRLRRVLAIAAVVANTVISVTGAVVRVTGSGLGCPTWPECFPGSMTPIEHPEFSALHQWIEYGNRLLSVVVGLVAAACLVAAWLSRPRRRRVVLLSAGLFGGVVVQGVIGGITVVTGLLWWTVAVHLLSSAVLVWLAVLLLRAIDEGDEPARPRTHRAVPAMLVAQTVVLGALMVAGTMVTGAGPHAGDKDVARLGVPVEPLAHAHGALLFLYLGMLIALGFVLRVGSVDRVIWRRYLVLLAVVLAQGLIGFVQFWTGVPAVLVVFHVAGAMLVVMASAALWCATRERGPRPADAAAAVANGSTANSTVGQRLSIGV